MSSTLLASASPATRAAMVRVAAGMPLGCVAAVFLLMTRLADFGIALVSVAIVASLFIEPSPVGRSGLVVGAVTWGFATAFGAITVGTLAAMTGTAMSGGRLPETPMGYALFLTLMLGTLGPILTVPLTALGAVWTVLVRRFGTALVATGA